MLEVNLLEWADIAMIGGHFVIGLFGAGAMLFISYLGLKDFQQLPKKIFTRTLTILYVLIGGAIAGIFSSLQPTIYAPIQALTIGAAWPALMHELTLSSRVKEIASEQEDKAKAFLIKLASDHK